MLTIIILQATNQGLGLYHPTVSHLLILLFTLALILDLFGLIGWKRPVSIASWLIVLGATLCYPALITGADAAKNLDPNLPNLKFHIQIAYAIVIYSTLYALLRLATYFQYVKLPALIYIILTLGLVYLSSWNSTFNLK